MGKNHHQYKTDERITVTSDVKESQIDRISASASGCSFVDSKTKANGGVTLKSVMPLTGALHNVA